jgi:hypothetical protein
VHPPPTLALLPQRNGTAPNTLNIILEIATVTAMIVPIGVTVLSDIPGARQ